MSWNVAILWKLCLCLISFYQFSINVIDANTVDFQSNDHGFNDSYKMLRGDPDRWIPSGYCENLQWKYSFRVDSDGPRQRGSYVFFALEPNTQYQVMMMMMMMMIIMMIMMTSLSKSMMFMMTQVRVQARNKHGWGGFSENFTFSTRATGEILKIVFLFHGADRWSVISDQWSMISDQWSFLFQATFQRSFRLRFIAVE